MNIALLAVATLSAFSPCCFYGHCVCFSFSSSSCHRRYIAGNIMTAASAAVDREVIVETGTNGDYDSLCISIFSRIQSLPRYCTDIILVFLSSLCLFSLSLSIFFLSHHLPSFSPPCRCSEMAHCKRADCVRLRHQLLIQWDISLMDGLAENSQQQLICIQRNLPFEAEQRSALSFIFCV